MRLQIVGGVPFVRAEVRLGGRSITLLHMLVDTGSSGTVLAAASAARLGIQAEPDDILHRMRGIGGVEAVYHRTVDEISAGVLKARPFTIEVGGLAYGFDLDGILGLDFLIETEAVVDLGKMELRKRRAGR